MAITTDRTGLDATAVAPADGIARWARLASLGLRLAAAGPLLMLAAGVAWGLDVGDEVGFFGVAAGLAIAGSFLVRSHRTVLRIAGIVLGVLTGLAVFWTAFGLFTPASVFDFVPGVLVLPGILTGIVAGVSAIRAERRGDLAVRPDGGERRGIAIALGIVGGLTVLSAVLTVATRDTVGADVATDVEVDLKDFEFDEDAYSLAPGDTVLVSNSDPFQHTFTVDALDIDFAVGPGSEKVVEIPAAASPDTYVVYCVPHTGDPDDPADDDMAAELEVG
jgi:plastocyanin